MRTLVTGGSGRLGRTVVAGLVASGHEVISIDRTSSPEADVEQIAADLTDATATGELMRRIRPDSVVHLAAIAVPFSAPEQTIFTTNTALAFSVMSAAIEAGVHRIAVASSPTAIGYGDPHGWLPPSFPLDERSPLTPWNAYALSKVVAESTMRMFARQTGDATRLAAFRPCYVIAPEEWEGALTQQGHTVHARLDDPALAAPALFNYVDARDVSSFLDLLLAGLDDIPNAETFFVGADDALARSPLAELLPRFVPGCEQLTAHLTGTEPAFSSAKATALLGWRPRHDWRHELSDITVGTNA